MLLKTVEYDPVKQYLTYKEHYKQKNEILSQQLTSRFCLLTSASHLCAGDGVNAALAAAGRDAGDANPRGRDRSPSLLFSHNY